MLHFSEKLALAILTSKNVALHPLLSTIWQNYSMFTQKQFAGLSNITFQAPFRKFIPKQWLVIVKTRNFEVGNRKMLIQQK